MEEQLRRRSVGAPAARSALLTILGEYVAPGHRTVYRETLVRALETLGYKRDAARQAVARSVAAAWLTSSRDGRRSRMALTPATHDMLSAGYRRIYRFGEPWTWNGRWLLVIVRVREDRRQIRDRLRTKLAWAGFGSLGGGLWLSPHANRESEVRAAVDGHRGAGVMAFSAQQLDGIGDSARVVDEAWHLEAVADQYVAFIRDFERVAPESAEQMFAAQTAMVHAWRKFPFLDPDLPDPLLPPRWPREEALALFRDRHERWHEAAETYFRSLTGGADSDDRR